MISADYCVFCGWVEEVRQRLGTRLLNVFSIYAVGLWSIQVRYAGNKLHIDKKL